MESVSEVKRFDYAVDELLQVRDALLNKILEDNKHRFTKNGLEIIYSYKSIFNRGLRWCNTLMEPILELLNGELMFQESSPHTTSQTSE